MPITADELKLNLRANARWVERAIVALYMNQTTREQCSGATTECNGVGFDKLDAPIGSTLAEQTLAGQTLAGSRLNVARRIALRHVKQLAAIFNAEALRAEPTTTAKFPINSIATRWIPMPTINDNTGV